MPEKFIITADPPTANGDLHIGHLSGPYFAADALTRHLRRQGHDVAFFSNADPHQTYVELTALKMGWTSQEVIDHFNGRILDTLAANDIALDLFGDEGSRQQQFIHEVFVDLLQRGELIEKDAELPYCEPCERFLYQAYIEGSCPHCSAHCYGNNCEACGLPNDPSDIGDPHCRLCGEAAPTRRSYRGLFLPLSKHQDALRQELEKRRGLYRPRVLKVVLKAFDQPLPDIPATIPSPYGMPVRLDGYEDQTWNVRLELLVGLVSTFDVWRDDQGADAWDWRDHPKTRIVHFHGIDNVFQYTVFFNTLLLASKLCWPLPEASVTNEFCLLDGKKFSTTRNYAIWGNDLLAKVSSNHLRFYLAWINPEVEEADFVLSEFADTTNRLLVRPWNHLVKTLRRSSDGDGGVPDSAVMERLKTQSQTMDEAFDMRSMSLRKAARVLSEVLDILSSVARTDAAHRDATLRAGIEIFAELAEPITPRLTASLRQRRAAEGPWDASLELAELSMDDLSRIGPQSGASDNA